MVTVALGSQSQIKQDAARKALQFLQIDAKLVAVAAQSGVPEQPFDDETLQGACNRAIHAAELVPEAEYSIAIESGLFLRSGRYIDIAIAVAYLPNGQLLQAESEAIEIPRAAVKEAISRGGDWTAGKVLQEQGLVRFHDDPHLSLVHRSRSAFISDAVLCLFQMMFL